MKLMQMKRKSLRRIEKLEPCKMNKQNNLMISNLNWNRPMKTHRRSISRTRTSKNAWFVMRIWNLIGTISKNKLGILWHVLITSSTKTAFTIGWINQQSVLTVMLTLRLTSRQATDLVWDRIQNSTRKLE